MAYRLWFLLLALALVDAALLSIEGMSIGLVAVTPTLVRVAGLLFVIFIYGRSGSEPRALSLMHIVSIICLYLPVTLVFTYLTAAWARPLVDPSLVAVDHALGIDWPALHAWVVARPVLEAVLSKVYMTFFLQVFVLEGILILRRQYREGWELLALSALICVASAVVAGLWPAEGAFGYFNIQPMNPYVTEFLAVRSGAIKIVGQNAPQGIIQFPSFHAVMAVLYIYAARRTGWIFWIVLPLDIILLLATPVIGGHHVADVLGGIAIAIIFILATRRYFERAFAAT